MIIFVDIVAGVLQNECTNLERAPGVFETGDERFSLLAKFVPTHSHALRSARATFSAVAPGGSHITREWNETRPHRHRTLVAFGDAVEKHDVLCSFEGRSVFAHPQIVRLLQMKASSKEKT